MFYVKFETSMYAGMQLEKFETEEEVVEFLNSHASNPDFEFTVIQGYEVEFEPVEICKRFRKKQMKLNPTICKQCIEYQTKNTLHAPMHMSGKGQLWCLISDGNGSHVKVWLDNDRVKIENNEMTDDAVENLSFNCEFVLEHMMADE